MQRKNALLRDITIFSCLTLPMFAVWAVQKRMVEKGRHRQPAAVQVAGPSQAAGALMPQVDRPERELGPDSPETLVSRNNLANALMAEGRYDEAEAAQRTLLSDMERTFDHEHPDMFRCRFNLALNLRVQGKMEDARHEMETVYKGWRNVLGEGHPRTLIARIVLDHLKPPLTLQP